MTLRPADELLPRARLCALVSLVGRGFPVAEAAADLERHDLEPAMTDDERRWLGGQVADADPWIGDVAIMLSWALGLSSDLDPDLDAARHMMEVLFTRSPPVKPRAEEEIAALRRDLELIAANPLGLDAVRWRLAALRWALDPAAAWPPAAAASPSPLPQ